MFSDDVFKVRNELVDGIGPWLWIKSDDAGWDAGAKGDWEKSHKQKLIEHVPEKGIIVQAGGNLGLYPRLMSEIFNMVYTFEPDPLNFQCLTANCQKDNIIKIQAALGNIHKMIIVRRLSMENVGMHRVEDNENSRIPQLMIDDLILPRCDCIYLDVEGYEMQALQGSIRTIARNNPVIFLERGHNEWDQVMSFMDSFGYEQVDESISDAIFKRKIIG